MDCATKCEAFITFFSLHSSYYAQLKKEEEEREKELAKKYRDRVCPLSQT